MDNKECQHNWQGVPEQGGMVQECTKCHATREKRVKLTEDQRQEIWEAGENDMYIEERLLESARLYIDENITQKLSDEQYDEAIDIYRDGFLGRNEPKSEDITVKVSPEILDAIAIMVGYGYEDEAKSYEENPTENHIFTSIKKVKKWAKEVQNA